MFVLYCCKYIAFYNFIFFFIPTRKEWFYSLKYLKIYLDINLIQSENNFARLNNYVECLSVLY